MISGWAPILRRSASNWKLLVGGGGTSITDIEDDVSGTGLSFFCNGSVCVVDGNLGNKSNTSEFCQWEINVLDTTQLSKPMSRWSYWFTYWSEECDGTSAISSILIILALGDVERGDVSSSAFFTLSWEVNSLKGVSGTVTFPLTSSMSILLSGF